MIKPGVAYTVDNTETEEEEKFSTVDALLDLVRCEESDIISEIRLNLSCGLSTFTSWLMFLLVKSMMADGIVWLFFIDL